MLSTRGRGGGQDPPPPTCSPSASLGLGSLSGPAHRACWSSCPGGAFCPISRLACPPQPPHLAFCLTLHWKGKPVLEVATSQPICVWKGKLRPREGHSEGEQSCCPCFPREPRVLLCPTVCVASRGPGPTGVGERVAGRSPLLHSTRRAASHGLEVDLCPSCACCLCPLGSSPECQASPARPPKSHPGQTWGRAGHVRGRKGEGWAVTGPFLSAGRLWGLGRALCEWDTLCARVPRALHGDRCDSPTC